jgi:KipI family sensor histidine kinase inhibitor
MHAASPACGYRVSAYGDSALLVHMDDLGGVHDAYRRLRQAQVPGVVDLVPAARTLLVVTDPGAADIPRIESALAVPSETVAASAAGDLVRIPVIYDGEDLEEVARLVGITVEEVITRHSAREYVAAFCGFLPGFAYLTGLDDGLHVPRLGTPRVRVPAGSVAIADQFTAVYPRQSPGGWRLIGRTDHELFDIEHDPPALLSPTTRVRFEPMDA